MKYVRNLALLAVVMLLTWSVGGGTAFGQAYNVLTTDYDTVTNAAVNIPLLKFELTGFNGDTLTSVKVRSYIEKEYAIQRISLFKNAATSAFQTYNITGRFDANYEATLAGFNVPLDANDTIIVKVDAWPDSVDTDTSYHLTGLEVVIPPSGIIIKNTAVRDTVFTDFVANPSIDATTGLWTGPPDYIVRFDLYAPDYDVAVTVLDTTTVPNVCTNMINVGDSLFILVNNPNEEVASNSVTVDLSAFGYASPVALNYHANGAGFADDSWTDTVRVIAANLDVIAGYTIQFTASDNAILNGSGGTGNLGHKTFQFTEPIDNIPPQFDSLKFYISGNYTGSDTSAALGDKLTIIAYMTSNGFFEIDHVTAVDTWNNFRSDTTTWQLDDVTNGNNVWRVDIWLTNPLPRDVPVGDTVLKHIYLYATDNACNEASDSLNLDNAIDLEPPVFSSTTYHTIANLDSTSCTNLGDSVQVAADLSSGSADVARVYGDFLDAGITGSNEQDLTDLGSGDWETRWKVGDLNDPTKDPDPLVAKDANSLPVDADYTVLLWAFDDAGNFDTLRTSAVTAVVGGGGVPLDTRRPTAIVPDAVTINKLPAGKLQLKWPASYPSQAGDAQYFYVYVDSTGAGFDYDNVFGTTFNTEYSADTNAWTSEFLTDSKTYRFVVRTKDDCGNPEFNTNVFQAEADAKAPFACVVYPDTGKYYGPSKPLNITATTTGVDLDSAWITYRRLDIPSGTWGPWIQWRGSNYMDVQGQTLYENVALGSLASTKGYYQLYVLTKDLAGNVLPLDSAMAHCSAFTFFWNPDQLIVDIVDINGATSPQTPCGFDVWRDSLNQANVTVQNPSTDSVYTIDSWVLFYYGGNPAVYDSVRIEFKDLQKVPFNWGFSVADWPKSNDGIPTKLYVRITDTRNGSAGIDSVTLCVPDVVAPDIYMTYPVAYQRVPIAKSSLNTVPVRAKINSTSYDPDYPVRVEFFYSTDAETWVKIGETGAALSKKAANVTISFPEYEVQWDNSMLTEGFYWLKAVVHDDKDNTKTTPLIKVFLDGTMPEMALTIPDAVMVNGELTLKDPGSGHYVDLVAEVTNTTVDIAKVEFFVSYRDSVDLVKFYHLIGQGDAASNNGIWHYRWYLDNSPWSSWMKCGFEYKVRLKVTDIAGNVYDDNDGDGQFDDYTFWANPFDPPIALNTPADLSKLLIRYSCGAPQVAISQVVTTKDAETRTYPTPSEYLGGPGVVYMKLGETVGVQSVIIDPDTTGVKQVEYFFYSPVQDDYVSVGVAKTPPYAISFDPLALGLIRQEDVQVNEYDSDIEAVLTDSLNQTTSDEITCWVLDTFPGNTKWKTPNTPYVWGTVDLSLWALDGEHYRQVTYMYKPAAGGDWTDITTVPGSTYGTSYFPGEWPTLNVVTDGAYILGFTTEDKDHNTTTVDDNPQITVNVQNALPTVTLLSPTDGSFFCEGQYFTADATNGPVGAVDFQYKAVTSTSWTNFPGSSDNFAPWAKFLTLDPEDALVDGYYNIRAYAVNQAGRTAYSDVITLFYDGTAPLARVLDFRASLNGETDTVDVEYNSDNESAWINKAIGTVDIEVAAFDSLSPMGSQAIYNSGVDWIGLYLTTSGGPSSEELIAADTLTAAEADGHHVFTWDISGLAAGEYQLLFKAYDKVGCNVGSQSVTVTILEFHTPYSLVAGIWKGKILGVSYAGEEVQFQYRKGSGNWIPIGIGEEVKTKSLYYPENRWQSYSVYSADWAPGDGTYDLRMLTGEGEDYSPILSGTIAGGVLTVTSNPESGFDQGTIERNQEDGCRMEGVARITSAYGYPFGVGISMDLDDPTDFSYSLVEFRNLPQQGTTQAYAGPFTFTEIGWGGVAYGQMFFCSNSDMIGYSNNQGVSAFWITKDLGTGGDVKVVTASGKDSTVVNIPPEWTDDRGGWDNGLVIWESSLPLPSIQDAWILTPVGNNNGMANYVGAPGAMCEGLCGVGDDQRYALITMTYDNTCNVPAESLMVAYWDGEGNWLTDGIYFPPTVYGHGLGFNTANHTVQFATNCFDGTFAVIKRTPYTGLNTVTRKDMFPKCGDVTGVFPTFWYQFTEAFPGAIDWNTLEVRLDGIPVYLYYDNGGSSPVKGTPKHDNTLQGEASYWEAEIDPVSAVVTLEYIKPNSPDSYADTSYDPSDLNRPMPCGEHTLWIGARDVQQRLQFLNDHFTVDCTKPVVTFPNSYVGKDPTIQFTITDDLSGVNWDSTFVDVFWVTNDDSSYYYGTKERVSFMQTFYPDQVKNYLSGNTATITTSYNLDNARAVLVVIYNGHRNADYYSGEYWQVDPGAYDQFDEFYLNDGGAQDCAGNMATPHMQYLTVDSKAPSITMTSTSNTCPLVFTIADDGSGITSDDITIREDDTPLPASALQHSASAVDAGGEWFFAPSGGGGLLYYCPTAGAKAEIVITDAVGNVGTIVVSPTNPIGEGDVTAEAGPNPFDPASEQFNLRINLKSSALVTVKIYDMGGDLVTTLRDGYSMNAGANLISWSGTTTGGVRVANGVYLAHIEAEGNGGSASTVVKIAVVEK